MAYRQSEHLRQQRRDAGLLRLQHLRRSSHFDVRSYGQRRHGAVVERRHLLRQHDVEQRHGLGQRQRQLRRDLGLAGVRRHYDGHRQLGHQHRLGQRLDSERQQRQRQRRLSHVYSPDSRGDRLAHRLARHRVVAGIDQAGQRPADARRRQHLQRQHAGERRHACARQLGGPAEQHAEPRRDGRPGLRRCRREFVRRPERDQQPLAGLDGLVARGPYGGRQRPNHHLLRLALGWRQPGQDRRRRADPRQRQRLRRDDGRQ